MVRRMRTETWVLIVTIALALLTPAALASEYADGVYEGSAQGYMGDVKVKAAVMDGKIALITSENGESDEVGKPAIDQLIDQVMEAQDPDVDAIAGATETSEAFISALKDALTQAGWVEEEKPPEIEIIVRRTPTPEPAPEVTPPPVAEVSEPEISFDNVVNEADGVAGISGDVGIVVIHWDSEGDVQLYRLEIADAEGNIVKRVDISDTRYLIEWSELPDSSTYTATVTAIPRNGTLEANGVSSETRFARYIPPMPTPPLTPETGEISDSWEQIIAAIDDGSARQRYAVGATKELNLGSLGTIHMQLAGFDLDERADGQGKVETTWIAVELLPDVHVMNEGSTNEGGWRDSDLRAYLQRAVLPALPSDIGERLICVKKIQELAGGDIQVTEDTLWIPDRSEVFGEDALYYDLFQNANKNREKTLNNFAHWWWLRSATSINCFKVVYSGGSSRSTNAYGSGGVALGFCL